MESSVMHGHERETLIGLEDITELAPYEGMEFESEDAARDFYSTYARSIGFQIRMSRYTRSRRDNSIISRRIVCSKEGFCETRPCDGLHSDQKQERASTRVGCKAMIMIKNVGPGKWTVTKFVKKHNHGPVPSRNPDARPANQDDNPMEKTHSDETDPVKEPFEGMEFESEEAAKLFYANYARLNGFRARISRYCRSRRDNSIISRQIVCSKEGFREVRTKKVMTDEGKTKRPRMITRVGCKAMIVVKKMDSGKWMVSKFEKEHNHSLSYSKAYPSASNITAGEVDHSAARITRSCEVKAEGYYAGTHCNSTDSLTVLYNNLCQEAIKFAKEGSVTEEVYHVAVSALKEAADKVAEVKRIRPTLPHSGCISERKQEVLQTKPITSLRSANDVGLKKTVPGPKILKESNPNHVLTDSRLSYCSDTYPQPHGLIINGRQCNCEPKGSYLHFGNIKDASSQEPNLNTNSDQAIHVKDKGILGSGETIVAIPAIPIALCMPVTQNLHGTSSAGGPYSVLAAPIQAVPISYCPAEAEPIRQPQRSFRDLGPFASFVSDLNNKQKGPNLLVHATALACGARIVPLEEAASIVKAVESKIRCGAAIISRLPSSNLTPLVSPLERSSPSTSRGAAKERERLAVGNPPAPLGKAGKMPAFDEIETDSEDSDISGSEGEDTSWISWFCSLRGNEFFCEIDDDYIQDDFNLCGLSNQVPYYDYALDLILDIESSNGDVFTEEQNELIESSAEMLYGLIHARYILTSKGLAAMLEKFKNYDFGRCPRVYCCGQPCLPAGQSDIPRSSTVKIYCPKCEDLHYPRSKYQGNIDGAYYGTTFPHLFLMTYPHLKPQKPSQQYVPRVFGFKLHKPS